MISKTPSTLFMVACESSGDTHAAHLAEELLKNYPNLKICGVGGPKMKDVGIEIFCDMTRMSAVGFGDVLRQYFTYRKIFYETIQQIESLKPDAVICIDSPAFNLRLAKKISKKTSVIYYISPQLWAWGKQRIHVVQKHIAKMLVILPFEEKFYANSNIDCEFVGHPLLDDIQPPTESERANTRSALNLKDSDVAVGLFAGSRKREVQRIFSIMLKSSALLQKKKTNLRFFYSRSKNIDENLYQKEIRKYPHLNLESPSCTYTELVTAMDFSLITSGTATLEATLIGTPFFLLYKTSLSTYLLGRLLIKVKFLGLANLLAERQIVPEFIQNKARPQTIAHEAEVLLNSPELYKKMKDSFLEIRMKLGQKGASKKAAEAVIQFLSNKT
jgi:lipid-A-disaccharide synthase